MGDEVGVVHGLPQARDELEDVGVVVEQGALVYEGVKLGGGLLVQGFVEVPLGLGQLQLDNADRQRGYLDVRRALRLGPAQLDPLQDALQLLQSPLPLSRPVTVPAHGVRDIAVELAEVPRRGVAALLTVPLHRPEVPVERTALTAFDPAEVVRVWVDLEEAHEGE